MRRSASEVIRNLEMRITRLERQASKSKLPTVDEVYEFMRRSSSTVGGRVIRSFPHYRDDDSSMTFEPAMREAQEDNHPEDWTYDYAYPLEEEVNKLLTDKFPSLKGVEKEWYVEVDTRGFININFDEKTFKMS